MVEPIPMTSPRRPIVRRNGFSEAAQSHQGFALIMPSFIPARVKFQSSLQTHKSLLAPLQGHQADTLVGPIICSQFGSRHWLRSRRIGHSSVNSCHQLAYSLKIWDSPGRVLSKARLDKFIQGCNGWIERRGLTSRSEERRVG